MLIWLKFSMSEYEKIKNEHKIKTNNTRFITPDV